LSKKAFLFLTLIFNSSTFPTYGNVIIWIPKPDKPSDLLPSYRPNNLFPPFSTIQEKLLLMWINPILSSNNIIPNTQIGFKYSSLHQVHRIIVIDHLKISSTPHVFSSTFPRHLTASDRKISSTKFGFFWPPYF